VGGVQHERRALNFALAALLAAGGWAGHSPVHGAPSPTRWVLVYTGGPNRPAYTVDDLLHLTAVVDTAGHPVGPLCDGVIFTEFKAVAGRYYMPWPNQQPSQGADWTAYIDSLVAPRGALARLDSAAVLTGTKVTFVVMVPYPDTSQHAFLYQDKQYDFHDAAARVEAEKAYLHQIAARVRALSLPHLVFHGFYWLNEGVKPGDSSVVSQVTAAAHAMNLHFLWIPSYRAAGATEWRAFGFDEAWYQPNYFFHPDVPLARFDSAMATARGAGMGMELEFDRRLFSDSLFRDRLGAYLAAFERAPDLRNRSIAIYEGAGALIQLSRATDAAHRALYERLVKVLRP
jgi:hypothetical protein